MPLLVYEQTSEIGSAFSHPSIHPPMKSNSDKLSISKITCTVQTWSHPEMVGDMSHRCDKRLQRLQKILCKRVYYFVNVYLNKNHMSETKQNHDGKPSYSALFTVIFVWLTSWRKFLTVRPLFRGLNNESSSATVTATKIISGQDNST